MKKTLQDQYLLIKEGKGHKDIFIKEAKRQFPGLIRNAATYTEVANVLKTKNLINENVIGLEPINQLEPSKKESYEVAFENFLAEAKKKKEEDEKAELKKPSKQVEEDAEKNFDYGDKKNPDNLIFDQIMKGYYAEMKDPKNESKTMEQLKAIVIKNLEKNPTYYTEKGQFGVKDLGYTSDVPGLGEPKEPKGKFKSSGYGDLKESKEPINEEDQIRKVVRSIINEELEEMVDSEENERYFIKDKKRRTTSQLPGFHKPSLGEEELEEGYDDVFEFKKDDTVMYMGEKHKVIFSDDHIVRLERNNGDVVTLNQPQADEKVRYQKDFTESVNESKIKKVIRESIEKELAEINKLAEYEVYESKLEKIAELIEKKCSRLSRLDEDEDLKALTDKKKVKELQRDIKKLEKAKAKLEKALAKKSKAAPKKKEVIDEDEPLGEGPDDVKNSGDVADNLERGAEAADKIKDELIGEESGKALEEETEEPIDYRQKSLERVASEAEEMFERLTGRDNAGGNMSDEDALANVLSEFPAYMGEEIEFAERHLMSKFDLGAA